MSIIPFCFPRQLVTRLPPTPPSQQPRYNVTLVDRAIQGVLPTPEPQDRYKPIFRVEADSFDRAAIEDSIITPGLECMRTPLGTPLDRVSVYVNNLTTEADGGYPSIQFQLYVASVDATELTAQGVWVPDLGGSAPVGMLVTFQGILFTAVELWGFAIPVGVNPDPHDFDVKATFTLQLDLNGAGPPTATGGGKLAAFSSPLVNLP